MKTTLILVFLIISFLGKSQTSDVMYVPDQKTLVVSYNNYSGFGLYGGGYLLTSSTDPFIYTTPAPRINRFGINISNNKISFMCGIYVGNYRDNLDASPDIWFKFYPLRTLLKTKNGPDLTLGLNYMKGFRYGFGLSIPFRGIY